MSSTFYLAVAFLIAIGLDIYFVRSWDRYKRLLQEQQGAEHRLVLRRELLKKAFGFDRVANAWRGFIAKKDPRQYVDAFEWSIVFIAAWLFAGSALINFDPTLLQLTGEHPESATRLILTEYAFRFHEIPLWDHFMQTGFPFSGDLLSHFWSPITTIPVLLWGGINGMKISVFIAFCLAGLGQWLLANVAGLKGMFRLWAAILFMYSGGLALLWRLGWYELLIGATCFPWVLAALWKALQNKDGASLAKAAFWVAMVLLTGGGYYPFYLLVCGLVILGSVLLFKQRGRKQAIIRCAIIGVLSLGLIAVMALPYLDSFKFISRESGKDMEQSGSQPITYALMNYVISTPDWYYTDILGTKGGWNWFYIGQLSLAPLILLPWIFAHRKTRPFAFTMCATALVLLLWVANRYFPVKYIYDWFDFLYDLRFPNRLLIIAAIPIIIISALCVQAGYVRIRKWIRRYTLAFQRNNQAVVISIKLRPALSFLAVILLAFSIVDVYKVNQQVAFVPQPLEQRTFTDLSWLKHYDPGLYYIQLGSFGLFWEWTPTAYLLQMPVINFVYNEHLRSSFDQNSPDSPFHASPKYQLQQSSDSAPEGGRLIRVYEGISVYYFPSALPFAFSAPGPDLQPGARLAMASVHPLDVKYDGPNRILVTGEAKDQDDRLVVLVSDYPGWKLVVDDAPGELIPINRYLGADMLPGKHNYLFIFDPPLHKVGLSISLTATLITLLMLSNNQLRIILKK